MTELRDEGNDSFSGAQIENDELTGKRDYESPEAIDISAQRVNYKRCDAQADDYGECQPNPTRSQTTKEGSGHRRRYDNRSKGSFDPGLWAVTVAKQTNFLTSFQGRLSKFVRIPMGGGLCYDSRVSSREER